MTKLDLKHTKLMFLTARQRQDGGDAKRAGRGARRLQLLNAERKIATLTRLTSREG